MDYISFTVAIIHYVAIPHICGQGHHQTTRRIVRIGAAAMVLLAFRVISNNAKLIAGWQFKFAPLMREVARPKEP
jgi:hypothetical protein